MATVVGKIVMLINLAIHAISTEKPEFRYVVGKFAVSLLEARKNMPYSEFQKMITQSIIQ